MKMGDLCIDQMYRSNAKKRPCSNGRGHLANAACTPRSRPYPSRSLAKRHKGKISHFLPFLLCPARIRRPATTKIPRKLPQFTVWPFKCSIRSERANDRLNLSSSRNFIRPNEMGPRMMGMIKMGTSKQGEWTHIPMEPSLSTGEGNPGDQDQLRRLSSLVDGFLRISMTGERRLQKQVAVVSTAGWNIFDCGRAIMSIAESHGKIFSPDVYADKVNRHA